MAHYTTGEFAKKIGVCNRTLVRWDKAGLLVAHRTPTNRRFYTEEQLQKYYADNWDRVNYINDLSNKCPTHLRVRNPTGEDVFWVVLFSGYDIEISGVKYPNQKATITVWCNYFTNDRKVVETIPNITHEQLPDIWLDVVKRYKVKRGKLVCDKQ